METCYSLFELIVDVNILLIKIRTSETIVMAIIMTSIVKRFINQCLKEDFT